jgi:hypothetical protein
LVSGRRIVSCYIRLKMRAGVELRTLGVLVMCAALGAGCRKAGTASGYPLYPNSGATLGLEKVARIEGPIFTIDDQRVAAKGRVFDVLPGCHVVVMENNVTVGSSEGGVAANVGHVVFAFETKPGYSYSIRLEFADSTGPYTTGRIKARERSPSGAVAFLHPAHGQQDIEDCRSWATGQGY